MQVFATGFRCVIGRPNEQKAMCVPVLHLDISSDAWVDELACVKKEVKETLDTYKHSYEYMVNDWTKAAAEIAAGKVQIDAATRIEEVDAALEQAKQRIDEVKTYAQYQEEEWGRAQEKPTAAGLTNPSAPVTNEDDTRWDYVWFGSYPQTEVDEKELDLQGAVFDANGDAVIGGEKYRRYQEGVSLITYRYYKWEPIRWRVLKKELNKKSNTLLLMSDIGLDAETYGSAGDGSGWSGSGLREFLNNMFYSTAFSEEEQKAIVAREDVEQLDGTDAEEGKDKIYVLSQKEAKDVSYGFIDNEKGSPSRKVKSSAYAQNKRSKYYGSTEECWWWLRDSANNWLVAEGDGSFGNLRSINGLVRGFAGGLCAPVLHLDLESEEWAAEDSEGNLVKAVAAERLIDQDDPLAVTKS